jgi:hypothetical protein
LQVVMVMLTVMVAGVEGVMMTGVVMTPGGGERNEQNSQ